MKQKTMKLWQMILMLILSLIMVITMFLPAFRINGDAVGDMAKSIGGDNYLGEIVQGAATEGFDEEIRSYEAEYGVKISKISPWNIMTHSFVRLFAGDQYAESDLNVKESLAGVEKSYGRLRIFLWLAYILLIIIMLITVLGFLLKWNKKIPLIINIVYGVMAAFLFGYLRFGLMGSLVKKAGDAMLGNLLGEIGGLVSGAGSAVMKKMLSHFYSVSFLIAFIIALCIILASVLCIILGKSKVNDGDDWEDEPEYKMGNDIPNVAVSPVEPNNVNVNPFAGMTAGSGAQVPPTEQVFTPQPVPVKQQKASAAPMGQVRCTKGVMTGQGFMLPADRKVIVGKSPQKANLVINNQNVSNIHCSIRYHAVTNRYIVKDHSTNGTFVNGVRLQKDVALEYPAGTVLSLADGSNEITLG